MTGTVSATVLALAVGGFASILTTLINRLFDHLDKKVMSKIITPETTQQIPALLAAFLQQRNGSVEAASPPAPSDTD